MFHREDMFRVNGSDPSSTSGNLPHYDAMCHRCYEAICIRDEDYCLFPAREGRILDVDT